ncbi:hypothetical protein WDW86_03420 [Bdellovibrionota bacterium FG-2]
MKKHRFLRPLVLSLLVSGSLSGGAFAYDLRVSVSEAREVLNHILEDARLHPEPKGSSEAERREFSANLLRSYRKGGAPGAMSAKYGEGPIEIKTAPFLGVVLNQKMPEIYPAAYAKAYKENFEKEVKRIHLETLFDEGLISNIVNGTVPADQKEVADQIGLCLATKVAAGKSPQCELDESDRVKNPSFFAKAWVKLTCGHSWLEPSDCRARKVIFNAAKGQLLAARLDPKVQEQVAREFAVKFSPLFREGFSEEISGRIAAFPALVSQKFRGEEDPFWSDHTPLVELDPTSFGKLSLKEFTSSVRADMGLSALLISSEDAKLRGLSAALFYASANKMLLLAGGEEAVIRNGRLEFAPGGGVDLAHPEKAPALLLGAFGGWGAQGAPGDFQFSPWDFAAYDPTAEAHPTAFRVFPSLFLLGPRGVPRASPGSSPYEAIGDLADIVTMSLDFLRYTLPGTPFWEHFGGNDELEKILEPSSPILFPRDGRLLAVGVLAAALKNLIAPIQGHVEMTDPGSSQGALGVLFHEIVRLSGRDPVGISVRGVSKMLLAASELDSSLAQDPAVPAELLAVLPKLGDALQVGALAMSAKGQSSDGGFCDRLDVPQTSSRTLSSNIWGLRALGRAYERSQMSVIKLSLKSGWHFLESFWPENGNLKPIEGGGAQSVNPSELWALLRLWDESQGRVRQDLSGEMDWTKWDRRMETLRATLWAQLKTEHGPVPLN